MSAYLSNELANTTTGLTTTAAVGYKPAATVYTARLRRLRATFTYASQTTGDTLVVGNLPNGSTFAFGVLTAGASSGSTTLAIGNSSSTGKYRAASAFTTTDTPTLFGLTTAVGASSPLTADEQVIVTLAAATAPASGTLVVDLYYSMP